MSEAVQMENLPYDSLAFALVLAPGRVPHLPSSTVLATAGHIHAHFLEGHAVRATEEIGHRGQDGSKREDRRGQTRAGFAPNLQPVQRA